MWCKPSASSQMFAVQLLSNSIVLQKEAWAFCTIYYSTYLLVILIHIDLDISKKTRLASIFPPWHMMCGTNHNTLWYYIHTGQTTEINYQKQILKTYTVSTSVTFLVIDQKGIALHTTYNVCFFGSFCLQKEKPSRRACRFMFLYTKYMYCPLDGQDIYLFFCTVGSKPFDGRRIHSQ